MANLQRQNTLFVSEDWIRIYEAIQNVEFRAYDFDNLTDAILNHLRDVFPEEFNDWIASSEFIMKVEVLAWLSQNISFRIDLNTRENFLATAERRDSLIRLAQNVSYKVSRVRGAAGRVRLESVRTNQILFDSNNIALQDREINWNDPRNEDWFEQFITVMNAAFSTRTQFGRPLIRVQDGNSRTEQYVFNGQAPSSGVFSFSTAVNGIELPFDIINSRVNKTTGEFEELSPSADNAFNVFYQTDGRGLSSRGTGFFFQLREGSLQFQEREFVDSEAVRIVDLEVPNTNNDDFFVQELDAQGNIEDTWQKVDTVFGESVSFLPTDRTDLIGRSGNQSEGDARKVYELDTLENDRVRVRFGDGTFGEIPVGRLRFWFRTSNPEPQVVTPSDVGRQSFTLPYVVNGVVFFLTMTVQLRETITNAASSETNFSIRTRANQVYFAQNRMITGRDYNGFFLRDNAIRKVKTVNRTFSGQSRYAKLHDPTGLYENLKVTAEDGRLYQERTRGERLVSADTDILRNSLLIQNTLQPILNGADKEQLYFNDYPETFFTQNVFWNETSIILEQSRGNLTVAGLPVKVGDAGTSPFDFVLRDSVLRMNSPRGSVVRIDRIIDDGDITNGIILERVIPDGVKVVSVFPPFRTRLTESEIVEIEQQLDLNLDFGLSWHQDTQTWEVITFDNLDKQEDGAMFCLDFQGDTSGTNKDASWMVQFEFVPGGDEEDQWLIVDRGLGLFFESARENDFYFANTEPVVDPETGRVENDRIVLMECNESRDSLRRRCIFNVDLSRLLECDIFCYEFAGDGTTTSFATSENPLSPSSIVTVDGVLQILGAGYTISTKITGDSIVFVTPPEDGARILVCISRNGALKSTATRVIQSSVMTDTFDLGYDTVRDRNVLLWQDGVMQRLGSDYTVGPHPITGNASIILNTPLAGSIITAYFLPDIGNNALDSFNYVGDGARTEYNIPVGNQTTDSVLISIDGATQAPSTYSLSPLDDSTTTITFVTPPADDTFIHVIAGNPPEFVKTNMYDFGTMDGIIQSFDLSNQTSAKAEGLVVFLDGVCQTGPNPPFTSGSQVWTLTGPTTLSFPAPPPAGTNLVVFSIQGAAGNDPNAAQGLAGLGLNDVPGDACFEIDNPDDPGNIGNVSTSSILVSYLGRNIPFFVTDTLKHPDGYVNPNGLEIRPADQDNSGFADNPFIFKDLVIQDGFTDLVLWRKIEQFGFTVFDPINVQTSPRGTYGRSDQGDVSVGTVADDSDAAKPKRAKNLGPVLDGDIHYDITTDTWLIANVNTTETWDAAPDQTLFRYEVGRDNLKFMWLHFAPDAFRIDPSVSNIMDAYLLTTAFDDTFRTALNNNTPAEDLPLAPTPEELRLQFAGFDDFKAMSDAIIYHPSRYKVLFGEQAIIELQATFKVVQADGSLLSDNDLRLRILETINIFFEVDNWDFGETFYLTELLSFIHQELAPNIQTIVAVPKDSTETFGRLFQIRAEPDELFISSASATDIEIVNSLTDEELRIGVVA